MNSALTLEPDQLGNLRQLYEATRNLSPDEKAVHLETNEKLASAHHASSVQGQSEVPDTEEEVDLHFICFIQHNGQLYEMDGRKPAPVNHGPSTDLITDAVSVVKKFMERDPGKWTRLQISDQLNFTLLALAPKQD